MNLHKIASLLDNETYQDVLKASAVFFENQSDERLHSYQVSKFNKIWNDAYRNIPFYSRWKEVNLLPDRIRNLSELYEWPIVSKQDISKNESLIYRDTPPSGVSITSGSTGIPLKLPVWHSNATKQNMWIGRAANGYLPGGKTFLIWGHHHLHGKGLAKIKNKAVRNLKDFCLNYKRISAYDTSIKAMSHAFKAYNSFKPQLIIGYSSSILSFVRTNQHMQNIHTPSLVICTAGPLSIKEKEEIRHFFKAPLCMEYGSVECGVMGYTVCDCDHYMVFWNTHIIQGKPDGKNYIKNIVTTLNNRYFPLIRYDIGDYLVIPEKEDLTSIHNITDIIGRPTDIVSLEDGTSFFPMLIEACVEHLNGIIAHQLIVKDNQLEILIVSMTQHSKADIESVYEKLYGVVPALKKQSIKISQVEELLKNKGGKTPLVIRG